MLAQRRAGKNWKCSCRVQISLQQNVVNVDTVSQQSVNLDDIHSVVYHCCHTQQFIADNLLLQCLTIQESLAKAKVSKRQPIRISS